MVVAQMVASLTFVLILALMVSVEDHAGRARALEGANSVLASSIVAKSYEIQKMLYDILKQKCKMKNLIY